MTPQQALEEAKKRYPEGTRYRCAVDTWYESIVESTGGFSIFKRKYIHGEDGKGVLYNIETDTWAEIIQPEKSPKNGWIDASKQTPDLLENENYSENVWAICNGQRMVMCYCYNPSEDDSERGYFWANCYGQIDGEAEFDDDYDVKYWQPFPSIEVE